MMVVYEQGVRSSGEVMSARPRTRLRLVLGCSEIIQIDFSNDFHVSLPSHASQSLQNCGICIALLG
jgi:hypothetical protein